MKPAEMLGSCANNAVDTLSKVSKLKFALKPAETGLFGPKRR